MPQTFYIDSDEEIISVIGRLRKSSEAENMFVFPKRALVLQSIVNLRLFQREAQKLGKKIILVTQDEIGRMLAEKAGIETQNYSDDFSQRAHHVELSPAPQVPLEADTQPALSPKAASVRSENIGSSDFFGGAPLAVTPTPTVSSSQPPQEGQKLRIRNASPYRPPGLNSERYREQMAPPKPPQPEPGLPPLSPAARPAYGALPPQSSYQAPQAVSPVPPSTQPYQDRDEALKRFYAQDKREMPLQAPMPPLPRPSLSSEKPDSPVIHEKAHKALYVFGIVSLLCLFGVVGYLFFPKVTVKVTPFSAVENIDLRFTGVSAGDTSAADRLPMRLVERDLTVTVTENASGSSSSSSQKARGTIVIYNDYSAEPQQLVATTRFETSDGKIFRLVDSVTVPGRTSSPGAVEAAVIADQAGESYNIEPTTFTIPGFRGSPKFEKFSAKSLKKMTGGGSAGGELLTIAKADLEKAESNARARAEEAFFVELKPTLTGSEALLRESMEIAPQESASLPQVGSAAETFDYTRTYKIRGFVLSEEALREKISVAAQKDVSGIPVSVADVTTDFGEITSNFEKKEASFRVRAEVTEVARIDEAKLVQELLGQDTAGIEALLPVHPEIEKIELVFKPDWFGASIPNSASRVTIEVVSPQPEESE